MNKPLRRLTAGLLAVLAAGSAYQAFATRRDASRFPPPGRLVDAGGHRLHLVVSGPDAGPTVVLDAGMGSFSANWHWVQEDLAATVRVVSYDRAGLGWSERGPRPRDAATLATELRAALRAAGVPGPYVLAGHSFGWLPVRAFAELYRAEVAGLVAVDGSHPDQWARWPTPHADRILTASNRLTGLLARFGLLRAVNLSAQVSTGLPARQVAELRAMTALPRTSAVEAEQLAGWAAGRALINAARPLGDLPLVVLGVTEQPFGAATLDALQADMTAGATNAIRYVVSGATHESLVADRRHAAVVADAIRTVAGLPRTSPVVLPAPTQRGRA